MPTCNVLDLIVDKFSVRRSVRPQYSGKVCTNSDILNSWSSLIICTKFICILNCKGVNCLILIHISISDYDLLYYVACFFQIAQLEKKLEQLKAEKHELFSQLKKVLHQEDETRKRAQIKEQKFVKFKVWFYCNLGVILCTYITHQHGIFSFLQNFSIIKLVSNHSNLREKVNIEYHHFSEIYG